MRVCSLKDRLPNLDELLEDGELKHKFFKTLILTSNVPHFSDLISIRRKFYPVGNLQVLPVKLTYHFNGLIVEKTMYPGVYKQILLAAEDSGFELVIGCESILEVVAALHELYPSLKEELKFPKISIDPSLIQGKVYLNLEPKKELVKENRTVVFRPRKKIIKHKFCEAIIFPTEDGFCVRSVTSWVKYRFEKDETVTLEDLELAVVRTPWGLGGVDRVRSALQKARQKLKVNIPKDWVQGKGFPISKFHPEETALAATA